MKSGGESSPARMRSSVSLRPKVPSVTFLWQVGAEVEGSGEAWAPEALPVFV